MKNNILKFRILLFCLTFVLTNVSAQIVSSNAFLQGNFVEVGISPCGSFGSTVDAPTGYHPRATYGNQLGFVADPAKDGWAIGSPNFVGDYFLPGDPEEGWGLTVNGINYNNNYLCSVNDISGSIIDYSNTVSEVSATWQGAVGGLNITARTHVPSNAAYFVTKVTILNTTNATINNVFYMRNVDPDQGVFTPGAGGGYTTNNTIVSQNPNATDTALASATSLQGDNFLGLGTIDSRARVTHGGFSNRSAMDIWSGSGFGLNTTGSNTADEAISLSFNLGNLEPNQSTTFSYVYILSIADLDIEEALAATSAISDITCTTAILKATSTETGTGYWMVVPNNSTAPTAAQIKNGTDYDAVTVITSGSGAITANTETPFNITGLNPATSYDVYFVSEDGTPAFSTIAKASISTLALDICTENEAPVITCPTNIVVNNDVDQCGAIVNFSATATGNPTPTITYVPASGSLFPFGTTSVEATATNSEGSSSCTFTVTVNDIQPPSITCPPDITVTDTQFCLATNISLGTLEVMDNCLKTGNALDFEGLSNGFKIPTTTADGIKAKIMEAPINGVSISAWIYPRASDPAFSTLEINGQIFEANIWQHIAFTYDTSLLKIYHNGELLGSVPIDIVQMFNIIENFNVTLPGVSSLLQNLNIPNFPLTLSGKLDEVHIWKGARTQLEIQREMNSEIDAQANLIALYHFNQGVAGGDNTGLVNVIDDSGNGFDVTLTNFALNGPTSNWAEGKSFNGVTIFNNAPKSYSPTDYTLDGYTLTWYGPNTATYPVGDTTIDWIAEDEAGNSTFCPQIVTVTAGDFVWTGAVDSDWTNDGNWQDVPGPGLFPYGNVSIPNGMPNYPILASGQDLYLSPCTVITIASDASVTINPTVVVTNDGTVINDGTMTFESDPTGTAYIGESLGSFVGDITIERHIPANRAFRFLSTPVNTSDFISNNWQQDTHITGSTLGANGFDATLTGNPSMYTFDNVNQTWDAIPNTDATNLVAGTPYRLIVRGDRTIDLYQPDNDPTPTPTTLVSKGDLFWENMGSRTIALNETADGFSLIGNPLQAQVDMKKVLTVDNVNVNPNFYWAWDPNLNVRGAYAVVDVATGSATAGDANQFLQAGQGCFVKTLSAGAASLTMSQSSKGTSLPETAVFKSNGKKSKTTANAGELRLALYESSALATNQTEADALKVVFGENGNNTVNDLDALKFTNLDENLAISHEGALLSIESRAIPEVTDEIQLAIDTYRNTGYTLVASGHALTGEKPYLYDAYTAIFTEIPQNGSVQYSYVVDGDIPASIAEDRFKIVFQAKTLSIGERDLASIAMYPNPTNTGAFYLNIPQSMDNLEVTIYNALGAKVYHASKLQAGREVSINTRITNSQGVYFVKLSANGASTTKKLVIN